ncbi:MAG: Mur ligase domain-containing protein, partial [Eubacteriales bacterium]|nr:Mur ligase domain-containing protein [Eubacteriales bacterium]
MKKIYFIGIGGISMSTLAVFLAVKGNVVSGSDLAISENLKILDNFGITYNVGHEAQNIKSFNPNLVVTNCAISEENE